MTKEKTFQIPAPNIQLMKVKVKGTAPLVYNRWAEKAIQMIVDGQEGKPKKNRGKRKPKEEYKNSFYYDSNGKISIPSIWLKQAMVSSARNINGLHMTLLRGAIFVTGDKDSLIPVKYKKKEMRQDMVRLANGSADIRYRGQISDWDTKFIIKYNADVLSAEQVLNLIQIAGFSCGIGEWRPQKNGDFGTFEWLIKAVWVRCNAVGNVLLGYGELRQ